MRKKRLIVGVLAVGLVAALIFGIRFAVEITRQEVIISLLNQNKAKAASLLQGERGVQLIHDFRHYAHEIDKIDYGACPTDFRLAWFDYVQSVHSVADHGMGNALAAGVEAIGAVYLKDGKLAERAENKLYQMDVARHYRRLQRIAIKYGVTFVAPQ